jgi:transcriptional regulator GlxA family with amidase domain
MSSQVEHDGAMRHRRVVIVVFDQVQGLDVFGPVDVFYFANYVAAQLGAATCPYTVEIAGQELGPLRTAGGPRLYVERALDDESLRPDVLLVAGGLYVETPARDERFVAQLRALAARSGEVGSICTGALLLAEAGLLDGRRATTHWALAATLVERHPDIDVDADRIYLFDGVWTSAGVTAGIDLALHLVRAHHGGEVAAAVARHLVVYLQRAGGQQQYSAHLAAQGSANPRMAELMAYIADHPDADLSVIALAARLTMSERSFQRWFRAETGTSPGRYVERTRVEAARRMLEQTDEGLSSIAHRCGFGTVETLHRAFRRLVGLTPGEYRERFPGNT